MSSSTESRAAVRLLQGYLWYSKEADIDLEHFLPKELESMGEDPVYVLWDEITPPFAFFDSGEPTSDQYFYQFTVLSVYEQKPSSERLQEDALLANRLLQPLLESTPQGLGWKLWEDLREL